MRKAFLQKQNKFNNKKKRSRKWEEKPEIFLTSIFGWFFFPFLSLENCIEMRSKQQKWKEAKEFTNFQQWNEEEFWKGER